MPAAKPATAGGIVLPPPTVVGYRTNDVAEMLNVPPYRLNNIIRLQKMARPKHDGSGRLLWSAEDIQAAARALKLDRRLKRPQAEVTP